MLFPHDVIREAQVPLDLANAVGVYERLHLLRHIKLVLLVVASSEEDDLRELAAHRAIVGVAGRRIPANVPGGKLHGRVRRTLQRLRLCASPEGKPCGKQYPQHQTSHEKTSCFLQRRARRHFAPAPFFIIHIRGTSAGRLPRFPLPCASPFPIPCIRSCKERAPPCSRAPFPSGRAPS